MEFELSGEIIEWRGPAPFYFVRVPDQIAEEIALLASQLSYGWGVIPATVTVGRTSVTTSIFPKDGGYLVPVKNAIRLPEKLSLGQVIELTLTFEA